MSMYCSTASRYSTPHTSRVHQAFILIPGIPRALPLNKTHRLNLADCLKKHFGTFKKHSPSHFHDLKQSVIQISQAAFKPYLIHHTYFKLVPNCSSQYAGVNCWPGSWV